jgi:metal-dependent amidase/aminoacylase/carboxypeptidase family protein
MAPAAGDESIDELVAGLEAGLISLRRDIHRRPELAGNERRTAALAADRLRAAGLSVSTGVGGHGVVAVLDGADSGPTIAYRADLDAVADDELFDSPFASEVAGAAHVCGHDLHTAIGVGVAQVLAQVRSRLRGRVVFVFQPAEETLDGARAMIEAGVLDRLAPREIYALHCAPLPVGAFAVMPGVGSPGLDIGQVDFSGPAAAADGERFLAEFNSLATVTPPQTPEQFAQLLADLFTPGGPLSRFVHTQSRLASTDDGAVRVDFSVRAWPDDRYPEIRKDVRGLANGIAGARITFPEPPFPAMVCSPELSTAAAAYLQSVSGVDAVQVLHASYPFNGEDFALFLNQVPGAMFFIGVANPEAGVNGVPHAPNFAADERAIGLGVRSMAGLLLSRLHDLRR